MTVAATGFPNGGRQGDRFVSANAVPPHSVMATHKIEMDTLLAAAWALQNAAPN
jgi:hypothetical protein